MTLRCLFTFALLVGACGPADFTVAVRTPHDGAAIVGGEAASTSEFPTIAFLLFETRGGTCTGTLIDDDVVLTAAHCLDPALALPPYPNQAALTADLHVLFGVDNANVPPPVTAVDARATTTVTHPQWDINQIGTNDIGVVFLDRDIAAPPVEIVTGVVDAPVGVEAALVGYGFDENGETGVLRVLRDKASGSCADIGLSDAECICFDQADGRGSCSGDSGGPAFVDVGGVMKTAGITSFGDASCSVFGAYTRLSAELEFLNDVLCANDFDGDCTSTCSAEGLTADPACAGGEGEGEGAGEGEGEGKGGGEGEGDGEPPSGCGCSTTSSASALWIAIAAALSVRVRTRRTPARPPHTESA